MDDEELLDLIDVLRQPLQGRPVLVPLGTQAFLEGTLDPRGFNRTSSSDDDEPIGETSAAGVSGGASDGDEEYVIIRTQDRDEEEMERTVTRQEAKEFFEAEREALLRASKQRRKSGETRKNGDASEQSVNEVSATQQLATGKPKSPATSKSSIPTVDLTASGGGNDDDDPPHSPAPAAFFEIREELDEEGREVRAEAVDVSRQLAMLESDAPGDSVGEAWTRRPHGSSVDAATDGCDATTMIETTRAATNTPSKNVMSDAEYERLSARLDELAVLEEQAERNRATNTASRTGLQGGGWSSGFLNAKKKKAPKPNKSNGAPPTSGKSQSTAEEQLSATSTAASEPRSRGVSFDPNRNDVREIPRIGQRSALELKKPQMPPPYQGMRSGESNPGGSGGAAAVSGVVRERVKSSSKKKQASPLQTGGVAPTASQSQPGQQQQPKRLSRFAQERLRQQQEQAER